MTDIVAVCDIFRVLKIPNRSRRVKVYVNEDVRGMIVVESDKRIASVRKLIHRTLLQKHEQNWWRADEVPLLLNGQIPILLTQNSHFLLDYLRDDDYLVVRTPSPLTL